jgi:pyruvate dehydrogenase E2 component (dihydrolipoamide acetyltransferase)
MESGVITQWLVKVGDAVKEEDVLAEVETDKATMPMKSYEDGTVAHLDVGVGDEVALGQRILVLAKKGEDPKQVAESFQGGARSAPEASKASKSSAARAPEPDEETTRTFQDRDEERTNTPTTPEVSTATNNGQEARAPAPAPVHQGAGAGAEGGGRIKSSPLARKIAAAARVDLHQVKGSGPGGRVVRNDVEAFVEARTAAPKAAPAPSATPRPLAAGRIPHTRMRKTIAQRMVQAKQEAPEIHVTVDARVDEIVAIRERLNKQLAAEKVKLSLGDFVTKAVALALKRHPAVNASFEPDAMVIHPEVHVGIAVALEGGLIVPVLHTPTRSASRDPDHERGPGRGRPQGTLTGEQLTGGTFTISNLGMYGVRQFDAILNLPQVGILAVGAAEKRPVVVGDALAVATVMTLTLTADHRAVDGATAADFCGPSRACSKNPPRCSCNHQAPAATGFARPFPRPHRRGDGNMAYDYDVLVIGGGPRGYAAAIRAASTEEARPLRRARQARRTSA